MTRIAPRLTRAAAPALALAAAAVLFAQPAAAEEDIIGSDEYRVSCAPCHGVGGRGAGPVAEHLNRQPPDLTTLAARNDGVFPIAHAIGVIDGRFGVAGHGDRAMPVWGNRYRAGLPGDDAHPINRIERDRLVHGRILELVNYLQAIQQPGEDGKAVDPLLGKRTIEQTAGQAD